MATRSVSYVKAHLAEVIEQVRESSDPVTITQNGTPTAVVVDHESHRRTKEALAMLKLVAMGVHRVDRGRTVPQAEVFEEARARLAAHQVEEGTSRERGADRKTVPKLSFGLSRQPAGRRVRWKAPR